MWRKREKNVERKFIQIYHEYNFFLMYYYKIGPQPFLNFRMRILLYLRIYTNVEKIICSNQKRFINID